MQVKQIVSGSLFICNAVLQKVVQYAVSPKMPCQHTFTPLPWGAITTSQLQEGYRSSSLKGKTTLLKVDMLFKTWTTPFIHH